MRKYKKGSNVRWSWGNGTGYGQVTDSFTRRVQRTINGSKIVKNGSRQLPGVPDRAGRRQPRAQAALGDRAQLINVRVVRHLVDFFARRAVPGVEEAVDGTYRRSLALDHGDGVVEVRRRRRHGVHPRRRARPPRRRAARARPVRPGHRHRADRRRAGRRPADRRSWSAPSRTGGCPVWSTGPSWRCAPCWASRSRWPAPPRWPGGWWPSTAGRSRVRSAP